MELKKGNENQIEFHILNKSIYQGQLFHLFQHFQTNNLLSFTVNSAFKSRDHESDSETISKFTILFGVERVVSPFFKQLPSNLSLNRDLFQSSFRERLLFAVCGGLNSSITIL